MIGVEGKSWYGFYQDRDPQRYLNYAVRRYEPFINLIDWEIDRGDRVLEIGCGMGTITKALMDRQLPADFWMMDKCPRMLALAGTNVEEARIVQGDARSLSVPTDVVFGHGVLEHFCDQDIVNIIGRHYVSGARVAIHYVPGDKYEKPSYGDERLMSVKDWKRIAAPDEVHVFNNSFDYALIWRFTHTTRH